MTLTYVGSHGQRDSGKFDEERLSIALVAPVWLQIPPPAYGGIEWIVHWLAEGLTARGHRVTLAATAGSTSRCDRRLSAYDEAPLGRIGEMLPELVHAVATYRRLGPHDVVHDHTIAGSTIAAAAGVEVLHTVHGAMDTESVRLLEELRGPKLVSISGDQRRRCPHLPWFATIHNAIDVSAFPLRTAKEGYLCTMARMCPDKGIIEAIELARALGMPLRIAAKCAEPAERRYFETEVAPRLGGGIDYVGELDTVTKKALLAGATALAFPIQWDEPFGMAVVEALACGTPVLTLARGAMPELVDHGITGLIGTDLDSLVSLAHDHLGDIDPRRCRAAAEARFHVTRLVDDYERVYYEMAHRRAPTRHDVMSG